MSKNHAWILYRSPFFELSNGFGGRKEKRRKREKKEEQEKRRRKGREGGGVESEIS